MASSVRFGKFRWSRSGYNSVMNSAGVQSMLARKARNVRDRADAMLLGDGYKLPGHEVKSFHGKHARGMVVRTKTDHARYAQAKRKTLTKSIMAAGR